MSAGSSDLGAISNHTNTIAAALMNGFAKRFPGKF